MNIYDVRHYGTAAFLIAASVCAACFIYFSNTLVKELAAQERARMQVWADATKQIVSLSTQEHSEPDESTMSFLLSIIQANTTIPVLLTDDQGNIIDNRNFHLPEPTDPLNPLYLSPPNETFLQNRLHHLQGTSNVIHIAVAPGINQHLYYEDSTLLRSLSLYPWIQLAIMAIFIAIVYYAVNSSRRAEQNKVWVGLSKETAHQLGTPISSLMAWVELMRETGIDPEMVAEMDKDVHRLSTIASRFGKIGSRPAMEATDLVETLRHATSYMATRISSRITLSFTSQVQRVMVNMSAPLLEWVMENLIKNAVDAMQGSGRIDVRLSQPSPHQVTVTVTDTGKGMSRKQRKNVFRPGYTTKKRGWGLGLTLAKRIVEQYHAGKIFVSHSEPGHGTTFTIQLPA